MNDKKVRCTIVIERCFSDAGNHLEEMYIDLIAKKIAETVNKMRTESFDKSISEKNLY